MVGAAGWYLCIQSALAYAYWMCAYEISHLHNVRKYTMHRDAWIYHGPSKLSRQ